ncbi:hypothetical protein F5B20DRAFT_30609 [Whalleya microplaca]|nr:hypothetical protein F5B20DRAFT_30609 [Whalleya microplaca]
MPRTISTAKAHLTTVESWLSFWTCFLTELLSPRYCLSGLLGYEQCHPSFSTVNTRHIPRPCNCVENSIQEVADP